jgi:hypothetical protein
MTRVHEMTLTASTRVALVPEAGFGLACFVGSAATVQKYAGTAATAGYLVLLVVAVPLVVRAASLWMPRLSTVTVVVLAVATLAVLVVLFALLYPHANTHSEGMGSDRDDAADMGARALLHGRWPYHGRTYLGNPISQLPGLLFLAVPFVALGHSAYAAFFWLPVLFLLLWHRRGEPQAPLFLIWLALLASPVLVREVVTGGDLVANTVSVMLAMWLVDAALTRSTGAFVLAGLVLGFVLSSRVTFFFVLPPLVVLAWRRCGLPRAVGVLLLAGVGFTAVTLPFYVGHSRFPPLSASDHLSVFEGSVPGGQWLVIAAALVLSVALALLVPAGLAGAFVQAASVWAFFLIAVAVHDSIQAGTLDLAQLTPGYGLPVLLLTLGALPGGAALARALRVSRTGVAATRFVD